MKHLSLTLWLLTASFAAFTQGMESQSSRIRHLTTEQALFWIGMEQYIARLSAYADSLELQVYEERCASDSLESSYRKQLRIQDELLRLGNQRYKEQGKQLKWARKERFIFAGGGVLVGVLVGVVLLRD